MSPGKLLAHLYKHIYHTSTSRLLVSRIIKSFSRALPQPTESPTCIVRYIQQPQLPPHSNTRLADSTPPPPPFAIQVASPSLAFTTHITARHVFHTPHHKGIRRHHPVAPQRVLRLPRPQRLPPHLARHPPRARRLRLPPGPLRPRPHPPRRVPLPRALRPLRHPHLPPQRHQRLPRQRLPRPAQAGELEAEHESGRRAGGAAGLAAGTVARRSARGSHRGAVQERPRGVRQGGEGLCGALRYGRANVSPRGDGGVDGGQRMADDDMKGDR